MMRVLSTLILVLTVTGVSALASEAPLLERIVVRVEVANQADVDFIAGWLEPWDVHLDKGMLITDVNGAQLQTLRESGFEVEIDQARTAKINRPLQRLKGQSTGIPGFPCYRSVQETLADVIALADDHPDLVELIDAGDSWEKTTSGGADGHDLLVLKITDNASGIPTADKAKLWVQGGIHARELVSPETVLRFAEYLVSNFGTDPNITWGLRSNEVYIMVLVNPDGREMAQMGLYWRKNTDDQTHASCEDMEIGVDLNRNFDFMWGCCGGSSPNPCAETYRGLRAASEPETRTVQDFLTANFPDWRPDDFTTPSPDDASGIFIDVHSSGGDVFTPTNFSDTPLPNNDAMLALGHKFSYFTGYSAQAGGNYAVDGSTTDWGYGRLGMPSYTFELGTEFFQQCSLFESTIYPDNLATLLYALKVNGAPFTLPTGPDVVSAMALPSVVAPGTQIAISATADDTRFGPGQEEIPMPIESIAAAEVTVNTPPGTESVEAIALTASDGAFDASAEQITGIIDTTGLSVGTHTAFIRAQDASGRWGPVEAVNFTILEEASAAHVSGRVLRRYSEAPLKAIVSAGPHAAVASAADGSYDLMLPPGTHEITANAPGFYPQSTGEIETPAGSTTTRDFVVSSFPGWLKDDVEDGNIGWTADPPWQITDTSSSTQGHAWTDSRFGNYDDGLSISLQSQPLNFVGRSDIVLEFTHHYDFEEDYDFGYVEISTDGGQTWRMLRSFTGTQNSWRREEIALPELNGELDVRLRFRLESDGYLNEDGWYVDDISLGGDLRISQEALEMNRTS